MSSVVGEQSALTRPSSGTVLLHDPTSHRRNTPRLVGRVAVALVAAVVVVVPQGMIATSVPIPSAPEDSRPAADDSVSPPLGAVITSPSQLSITAEVNPQADPNPTYVW